MKTKKLWTGSAFLGVVCALLLTAAPAVRCDVIPFDDHKLYFEMNSTDEDLGLQIMLDGEPWKKILIFNPQWRMIVDIAARGNARVVGLTELFSESSEPPLTEFTLQEWLDLFPEGEYWFYGWSAENDFLYGVATFTHNIPDGPDIVSPVDGSSVDPDQPLVVEWTPVADPDPPESKIEAYQIIVEKDEEDERLRVFSVDMPADATSVTVPAEFFEEGKDYKVEVLAIETSDNQTITEIEFETED